MTDTDTVTRRWRLLADDELDEVPDPTWLIGDHLTDGLTVLYGPSDSGKTFLALDWALSVASGVSWHGKDTVQRNALYVSGEGHAGMKHRRAAWRTSQQQWSIPCWYIMHGVKFMEQMEVDLLSMDLHHTGAGLLVVDTLARSMAGGDENSSNDVGIVISRLDELREKHGCAVVVVHHTGHEKSRPRGSTALFGAADTVVRCEGDGDRIFVDCDKQKDAPKFHSWVFGMKQIGRSVVLEQKGRGQKGGPTNPWDNGQAF